jgi:uncharacterized membrane protein YfcA
MLTPSISSPASRGAPAAFGGGAIIGALGGLIGLGGAEFRLPLLIGAFRFPALQDHHVRRGSHRVEAARLGVSS